MNYMMLWLNNDPKKALVDKIQEAARFYQEKYAYTPNCCRVPLGTLAPLSVLEVDGIRVTESRLVLKNHLEIGVEVERC